MFTKILLVVIIYGLGCTKLVQAQELANQLISLRVENAPLKEVLNQIEKKASVKFVYTNQVNKKEKVSIAVSQVPLTKLLDELFLPLGIQYQLKENGFITLKKMKPVLLNELEWKQPGTAVIRPTTSQITITGRVTEVSTNKGIPGVNVVVKGTLQGSITDAEGHYSILADTNSTLLFSYVGYLTKKMDVNAQNRIDASLQADIKSLDEVVITALGVEREKRSLGYAMQTIPGEDLVKARETNILNSLAGKMAGVTILNNPTGIGGSVRITIRGERSLNINKNQPLFVVDGVPVTNEIFASYGRNQQEVDYGNGAGIFNPDDIESITVLKGANATALYGSRGQNGVVLIKTKSGKGDKGMGVSFSSTLTFENPLRLPTYQNVYGQGINGTFEFEEDLGSVNWGPKMDGQLIKQFDSPTTHGFRGGDVGNMYTQIGAVDLPKQLAIRGEIIPTPFVAHANNVKDFFQTGITTTQHIAVNGSNTKGNIRVSYTYANQKGIIPNTDLKRHTIALSTGYNLTSRLHIRLSSSYIKNLSDNRPNVTYGNENLMFFFTWLGRSVNMSSLQHYWQAGRTGLNQFNSSYGAHDNPYFNVYENTNGQETDRLFGNIAATYQFTNWLNLMLRIGTDYSNEFRNRKRAYSSQKFPLGAYREEQIFLQETNADFLLSATKMLSTDFNVLANVGGNLLYRQLHLSDISAPQLAVSGVYNMTNTRLPLEYGNFHSAKRTNSLYAFTQLGFRDYLFLDVTARNDWSSTLPQGNWSYFYPSLSMSAVISDILNFTNRYIGFAKVRAGIASVGNDTDPYQLASTFFVQLPVQGTPTYAESAFIPNAGLKPEKSRSAEAGLDLRFFDNRIQMDVSVYHTRSKNQILNAQVSNTSGYRNRLINAGLIENKGVEAILSMVPVQVDNRFKWTIDINFSLNRSKVRELYTDPVTGQKIESHVISSRYINIQAGVGDRMGDMYGIGYERVNTDPNSLYYDPTGKYAGQIVYNEKGAPLATTNTIKLGNYNPDWLGGFSNTFTYKTLALSILFDIRQGGELYSHTQTIGREAGSLIETLEGRENGYDMSLPGNGVVGEGVVAVKNTEGKITGFIPNTTKLPAQEWHTAVTANRRILEPMVYDASFIKLREIKLGYTLPAPWIKQTPLQSVTFSLVGRNLFLWTRVPHIDPETASTAGGTIIPGIDSLALPSVRSYGFNLSIKL